ncbi:hypothetical protein [Embleya sp. AB8]|uniref:hypothetical protein n=1 Tax=Embleya sp. AB8 TaxID=3156304 RepID=UPI003C762ADE
MPDRSATTEPARESAPEAGAQPLAFHVLSFQPEGDEVTVGRLDDGEFVVLPADGAALLRRLYDGRPPSEAADWYLATYGESVDIADFVADLGELGFLRARDGSAPAPPAPVRWMRLGRAVFSPFGAAAFLALLAGWVIEMVRSPDLVPSYEHLFFTRYMSVIAVTLFAAQIPLILFHEAAHALAGRRLGLRSRLSIGRRLYFVVFQTTMDGLVAVPRRKRFLPILAGMLTDLAVLAALALIADATRDTDGDFSTTGAVCLGIAYPVLLRLIWQGWFFLQTDVYYLAVTVLGCFNLQVTSKQLLANRWSRVRRRPARHDPQQWHPRDRAVARWYSNVMLVGYGIALATLALTLPPIAGRVIDNVAGGGSGGGLLDSVLFLLMATGELGVACGLYLRERRAREQRAPTAPVT